MNFNIPRTTIEYWIKTENNVREDTKDKKRSAHEGPKLKFEEYEEEIYNLIIFNRKLKLPLTIYAIDKKFRESNSEFEADKINTRISWIYRFMRTYNLSIRKPTQVGKIIHQYIINEVTKFDINLRADLYDLKFV